MDHSKRIRDEFLAKGIRAAHIDGKTPMYEREHTLACLESGAIQVVTNCSVLVEGLDITSVSAVSLAVPTRSLSKYLQMVGRASRPHPGKKDFMVLDHGGCVLRHGTPDHDREWSIKSKERGKAAEKGVLMARICKACMFANPPKVEICEQCGDKLIQEREVEHRAGELVEVKANTSPMSKERAHRIRKYFHNKRVRDMDAFYESIR